MRDFWFYWIIFLLLFGCKSDRENTNRDHVDELLILDVVSAIKKRHDLRISEIASEINYIPLETTSKNVIDEIQKVVFTENLIFVCDNRNLFQFTIDGKYIQQIGSHGRGPGEYLSIIDFAVNEHSNTVIVIGEYSTNEYNFEGEHINTFIQPPGIRLEFINQNRIVFYKNNNSNSPVNLVITSLDLDPIMEFYNLNPKPENNYGLLCAPIYKFKNHICFKEHWNDTVFLVNDSILVPHYIINENDLLLDKSFELNTSATVSELINQLEDVEDKLISHTIFETERFVFVSYLQGVYQKIPKFKRFLFDKELSTSYCLNRGEFINDIDGGFSFYPMGITGAGVLVQWLNAYDLKSYTESGDYALFSTMGDTIKRNDLEKLVSNIADDDNPVLVMIKPRE